MDQFVFRQCEWNECRFRFPIEASSPKAGRCPKCGAATIVASTPGAVPLDLAAEPANARFSGLLDNIRSLHNVGSMFRSADGADVKHLYLCGITATPMHPNLGKAALGAQESVSWSYGLNGVDMAQSLKAAGHELWAVETAAESRAFFDTELAVGSRRVVIVVGNERAGIDPGLLALCDRILSLPMAGQKRSLNVAVAFGIVCYYLRYAK